MKETTQSPISIEDYIYPLTEDRIAHFPLKERSDSKLLVYNNGNIKHQNFKDVSSLIPSDSTLVFNNTKVIPARLHFVKDTGAQIEVFLLNPISPSNLVEEVMEVKGECQWDCIIGNLKKFKDDTVLIQELTIEGTSTALKTKIVDREKRIVQFFWEGDFSFSEIIQAFGAIPLPPYIKREEQEADKDRYQTVYSKSEGAVAAPTAGLHFNDKILDEIKSKNVTLEEVTLHVGAGTFKPVQVENAIEHDMHSEKMVLSKTNIKNLLEAKSITCVGTTSVRTLESLYWWGVMLAKDKNASFQIEKLYPYQDNLPQLSRQDSMQNILDYMEEKDINYIDGATEIFIIPGYQFRMTDRLITNFHLPKSTLLMLICAFIGEDWKTVYQAALDNNYRFLSYGDSSLLFKKI